MKRVTQKDGSGCGIACFAVITGQTYQRAREFFEKRVFSPKDKKPYTRGYQLQRGLERYGMETRKKLFRRWHLIETNAIVPINRQQDGGWHWVVFIRDGNRPYILDPLPGKSSRRYDFRGINARGFYIAILGRQTKRGT